MPLAPSAVGDILDLLCSSGLRQTVHFLWRPRLNDVTDDLVLEAAVNGQCQTIVTWNIRDFRPAAAFGIQVTSFDKFLNPRPESTP